jgi:hypothetical protein
MIKKLAVTISAMVFVMLAIALAPNVPAALATARTTAAKDDAKLNQPLAQQSCAAFEIWFLDPTCRQVHVKKAARTKPHLAHNISRQRLRTCYGEGLSAPILHTRRPVARRDREK